MDITLGSLSLNDKRIFKVAKLGICILVFIVFLSIVSMARDPDLGWHIAVGNWILEHHTVQRVDIYTNTMAGYVWADHEWLPNAFLAFMNQHNLWGIVILFFTLLSVTPVIVWIIRARSWVSVWMASLLSIKLWGFIGVRPQVISFFIFFALFEFLSAVFIKKSASRRLYYLLTPLLFFVWANIHAGFVGGLVLVGIFTAVEILWPAFRAMRGLRGILKDSCVFVASAAVTLINPYGFGLYKEIIAIMTSSDTAKYIVEWQHAPLMFPIFYAIVLAAVFNFALKFFRRYSQYSLAAVVVFLISFTKSIRMGPLFFVAFVPFFDEGVLFLKEEIRRFDSDAFRRIWKIANVAMVAFPTVIFIYGWYLLFGGSIGLPQKAPSFVCCPDAAVRFLDAEASHGRKIVLFNEYGWGGYLILHAPQFKVFIDGRGPHWVDPDGNSAMKDYIALEYPKDDATRLETPSILKRRGVTAVFIRTAPRKTTETGSVLSHISSVISGSIQKSKMLQTIISGIRGKQKPEDLETFLLHNGWYVAYQDTMATILFQK